MEGWGCYLEVFVSLSTFVYRRRLYEERAGASRAESTYSNNLYPTCRYRRRSSAHRSPARALIKNRDCAAGSLYQVAPFSRAKYECRQPASPSSRRSSTSRPDSAHVMSTCCKFEPALIELLWHRDAAASLKLGAEAQIGRRIVSSVVSTINTIIRSETLPLPEMILRSAELAITKNESKSTAYENRTKFPKSGGLERNGPRDECVRGAASNRRSYRDKFVVTISLRTLIPSCSAALLSIASSGYPNQRIATDRHFNFSSPSSSPDCRRLPCLGGQSSFARPTSAARTASRESR